MIQTVIMLCYQSRNANKTKYQKRKQILWYLAYGHRSVLPPLHRGIQNRNPKMFNVCLMFLKMKKIPENEKPSKALLFEGFRW